MYANGYDKRIPMEGRKEGNVLFNDALNTFYFTVIWRRTYGKGPLRLTARVLLYVPYKTIYIQDSTYHGLCYTSRGALAGTRNSAVGPPHEGSIRRPIRSLFQWSVCPKVVVFLVCVCVVFYLFILFLFFLFDSTLFLHYLFRIELNAINCNRTTTKIFTWKQ